MNKETTASNKQANKNKKHKKCTNTKEYVTRQNKPKKGSHAKVHKWYTNKIDKKQGDMGGPPVIKKGQVISLNGPAIHKGSKN